MKEHGILFSAPMVRALLAGTKTQTRRLVKEPKCARVHGRRSLPHDSFFVDDGFTGGKEPYLHWKYTGGDHGDDVLHSRVYAPHGPVGRIVYAKETWAAFTHPDYYTGECDELTCSPAEMRDPNGQWVDASDVVFAADGKSFPERWRPSIHMPRWAARLWFRVTRVRLERVQAITEEDARAEGVTTSTDGLVNGKKGVIHTFGPDAHRKMYALLWDEINGAGSWGANPWVWVYDFRRVDGRGR